MKATLLGGSLAYIDNCYIIVPNTPVIVSTFPAGMIPLRILPEVSDTKSAGYQDVPVIGRSFPIKVFSHGENRSITMKVHFVILSAEDAGNNLRALRALQSAVYPRTNQPENLYLPPPICQIRVGNLLSQADLCVVMKQYNWSVPTDVAWYDADGSYVPYKFSVDLTWDVVYPNEDLPGQELILQDI